MAPAAANSGGNVGNKRPNGAPVIWKVHAVLTLVQCAYAGAAIIVKVAFTGGINPIVFSVYRDVVSLCFLVPVAFFSERGRRRPLDWTTLALAFLLGFIGMYAAQLLVVFGISLAPASYVSLIAITTPIFVFLISAAFGLEEIQWTRRGGQAKLIGVLSAVLGGSLIALYKGPVIIGSFRGAHVIPLSELPLEHVHGVLGATLANLMIEDWQLGGFLLILAGSMFAVYWTLQAHVIKRFPAPVSMTALAFVAGAMMLTATGLLTIQNRSDWAILQLSDIITILYAGFFTSGLNFALQSWVLLESGPVLLQSYYPLQSFATVVMAYLFLGESIHLGSVLGLLCIIIGLLSITWGQTTNRKKVDHLVKTLPSPLDGVFIIRADSNLEQQLLE